MKMTSYEKECLYNMEEKIKQGNIYAMEEWATFYSMNHPDCIDDEMVKKIIQYYEKAIEAGSYRAMLNLGVIYYRGDIVERNYLKAVELYEMASKSDNDDIASIALSNLGYCHYYGRDIPVNYEIAYKYYLKGAINYKNADCYFKLGDMYRYGYYVKKDEDFAFNFYNLAYENCYSDDESYPDILIRIGECYLDGVCVQKDVNKALQFLTKAEGLMFEKVYVENDKLAVPVLEKLEKNIDRAKQILISKSNLKEE